MIFDNHRPLLQYAERDSAEEKWRCDAADQPTRNQYLSMLYPELQFGWKPDDPHQQDSNKYLKNANNIRIRSRHNKLSKKLKGISRKLTFQLLTH
jgi:hypothetical protein